MLHLYINYFNSLYTEPLERFLNACVHACLRADTKQCTYNEAYFFAYCLLLINKSIYFSGQCWCVDPVRGTEIRGSRQRLGMITCHKSKYCADTFIHNFFFTCVNCCFRNVITGTLYLVKVVQTFLDSEGHTRKPVCSYKRHINYNINCLPI